MTLPTIVPTGFDGTSDDFLKARVDRSGALRIVAGSVSVPNGTAADTYIGLVPLQAGARLDLDSESVHCGNFGGGSTTVNLGIIYDDNTNNTNDPDAFASLSTAAQSGGFIAIDEITGLTLRTTANAWLAVQIVAAAADATADITFNVAVAYDN